MSGLSDYYNERMDQLRQQIALNNTQSELAIDRNLVQSTNIIESRAALTMQNVALQQVELDKANAEAQKRIEAEIANNGKAAAIALQEVVKQEGFTQ